MGIQVGGGQFDLAPNQTRISHRVSWTVTAFLVDKKGRNRWPRPCSALKHIKTALIRPRDRFN